MKVMFRSFPTSVWNCTDMYLIPGREQQVSMKQCKAGARILKAKLFRRLASYRTNLLSKFIALRLLMPRGSMHSLRAAPEMR